AHLVNAGWKVVLLDIVPDGADSSPKSRNGMAAKGLERTKKARPAAFFVPENVQRIELGNIEDNLARCKDADWVVEAVVEKPDIKARIHAAIEANLGPDTLITTNTSGLSISEMCAGRSAGFRERFFGTHFFN